MANPLESLMSGSAPSAAVEGPMGTPEASGALPAETQRQNANLMDAPVPGQSLTSEPGSKAWERPPEFNTETDAMDFLFNKVTRQETQTNLLRVMDAGVPISIIIEPILMHGVQEGKWSMDLALSLMEPLGVVLYGMGKQAGVSPRLGVPEKPKGGGLDPEPLAKIFKNTIEDRKAALSKESPSPKASGLLSRPRGDK